MIISKTPYRISFFGGGTDYPSWCDHNIGEVLSTSIDKYIYLTCRVRKNYFDENFRIVWSKIENVKNVNLIKHNAVRKIFINEKVKLPLEIHYDGDLPAQSGTGSSSSFVVGLTHILSTLKGNKINKYSLAEKSIFFEQKILKETVGSQDQVAASYGGFNNIIFKKKKFIAKPFVFKNKTKEILNENLLIMYLGVQRKTSNNIAKKYAKQLNSKSQLKNMQSIYESVSIAKNYLIKDDVDSFGHLLGEVWERKKELGRGISNNLIDTIYNKAKKSGALGGKLLGAGGGGFFLFYVKKKDQKNFKKIFKNYIFTDFKFEKEGSQIIYDNEKKVNFQEKLI